MYGYYKFVDRGETPLDIAIRHRNMRMVRLLHRYGARTTRQFKNSSLDCRWLPLFAAMIVCYSGLDLEVGGKKVKPCPILRDLGLCNENAFPHLFGSGIIDESRIERHLIQCILRYGARFVEFLPLLSPVSPSCFPIEISLADPGVLDACVYDGDRHWKSRTLYPYLKEHLSDGSLDTRSVAGALVIALL